MRVIIEIPWGPSRGKKAILAPGQVLRVGRTERADLVVPHDARMSATHFELSWDGSMCRVRDRNSTGGTLLNGEEVKEAAVESGDWIRAGDTVLSIYFERATPRKPRPRIAGRSGNVLTKARRTRVLEALRAEERPLFAVLDASRSDRVLTLLRESVEEYRSLYEGVQGDALGDVAPYIVELPKGSTLLDALVREGWQRRWGMFLTSDRPFKMVRRHFRRFLMVKEEETGEPLYFRFYDPVVLRVFLPTCSVRQRHEFFGDILSFFVEGERGDVLRFGPDEAEGTSVG